jgi:hypothetical protein
MQSTSDTQTLARKVGFDPEHLQEFEAKIFIEGPQTDRRLTNFFVLLLQATSASAALLASTVLALGITA